MRRRAIVALVAAVAAARARAQPAPLRVAIVPFLSPRAMVTQFEPMREHLESSLGRPVEIVSASSFAALAEGMRSGAHPFTLAPMHLVRLAVTDWRHTLVVRSAAETPVVLLAPRRLQLSGTAMLRGKRVAMIDPMALTTIVLRRWLAAQGLESEVQLVHTPTAASAMLAIERGDVEMMVVTQGQALGVPGLRPEDFSLVATLAKVIGPGFVAHPDVPPAELAAFRRAMLAFTPPNGLQLGPGSPYAEATPRDLEPYEPYAADLRRLLAAPRPAR